MSQWPEELTWVTQCIHSPFLSVHSGAARCLIRTAQRRHLYSWFPHRSSFPNMGGVLPGPLLLMAVTRTCSGFSRWAGGWSRRHAWQYAWSGVSCHWCSHASSWSWWAEANAIYFHISLMGDFAVVTNFCISQFKLSYMVVTISEFQWLKTKRFMFCTYNQCTILNRHIHHTYWWTSTWPPIFTYCK